MPDQPAGGESRHEELLDCTSVGATGRPGFIMVGEMRDLETIRLALAAAETGHLVFGTLHTT